MTADEQRETLLERVTSAWRGRDPDSRIKWHPAWFDLDPADREAAFEVTAEQRQLEAALDPDGLSGTGRAVLDRIRGTRR